MEDKLEGLEEKDTVERMEFEDGLVVLTVEYEVEGLDV